MNTTKIEWTDKTWNPVTGCSKISKGCANCYAEIMAKRLKAMNQAKYINGFNVTLHNKVIKEPLYWKKPHIIFVCSMGDLFHAEVPFDFIDKVIITIKKTPQHIYQILTKRPERMKNYFSSKEIPDNVWLGTTVENKESLNRIKYLKSLNASLKFLSCEPLLENLEKIDFSGIDWVIVGGESGFKARPMKESWVLNIKKQADDNNVAFFFKQWGTWGSDGVKRNKKINGKLINGQLFQDMPLVS